MFNLNIPENIIEKYDEIIRLIEDGKIAIFFGSGISVKSPSNLPTGKTLTYKIIKSLLGNDNIDDSIFDKIYSLQFEELIERINNNLSKNKGASIVDMLVNVMKTGKPNINHYFIANLYNEGYLKRCMTTNFDTKIENAIENMYKNGFWNSDYNLSIVIREGEMEKIKKQLLDTMMLFKIHGTIDDVDSIRTTLNYISSNILLELRDKIIEDFFFRCENDIIIMGYSGSDDFDVNPVLKRKLNTKNRIIKINRFKNNKYEIKKLEEPFNNFSGFSLDVDFDEFIMYLCHHFRFDIKLENKLDVEWGTELLYWQQKLKDEYRLAVLAIIFHRISEYDLAIEYYEKSSYYFRQNNDLIGEAINLNNIASIHLEKNEFDFAENKILKSIQMFHELEHFGEAASYGLLGSLYFNQNKYDDALINYNISLKLNRKNDNPIGIARNLHNLGNIYSREKKYKKAAKYYRESLSLHKKLGDQNGISTNLTQLALMSSFNGNNKEAIKLLNEGLKIKRKIGDIKTIANILNNLTMIYIKEKNYQSAINTGKECLELKLQYSFEKEDIIGIMSDLAKCYFMIGKILESDHYFNLVNQIFIEQKEYNKSIELYKKLIQTYKKIKFNHGLYNSHFQLGRTFRELKQYEESIKSYEQSLNEAKNIDYVYGIASSLSQTGVVHQVQNNFDLAIEFYKKGIDYFEKINEETQIIFCKYNIAHCLIKLNKKSEGSKLLEEIEPKLREIPQEDLFFV